MKTGTICNIRGSYDDISIEKRFYNIYIIYHTNIRLL